MENTKKLSPAPFKTYLLGYYAVKGSVNPCLNITSASQAAH